VLHASTWEGIPIFTPQMALGMAQFTWWYGEEDERHVLEEWHSVEEPGTDPEQDHGVPRRTWFDKLLPREATGARKIVRDSTLSWSGELGRLILELAAAARAAKRRRTRFALHTQQDDLSCLGFGATLRWSTRDPMPRVFDDHAHGLYESSMVEDAWGWMVCGEPKELPRSSPRSSSASRSPACRKS
jgi:PRTRC genetic system protein F